MRTSVTPRSRVILHISSAMGMISLFAPSPKATKWRSCSTYHGMFCVWARAWPNKVIKGGWGHQIWYYSSLVGYVKYLVNMLASLYKASKKNIKHKPIIRNKTENEWNRFPRISWLNLNIAADIEPKQFTRTKADFGIRSVGEPNVAKGCKNHGDARFTGQRCRCIGP